MEVFIKTIGDCWVNNIPGNEDTNYNKDELGWGMWVRGLNRSFLKFSLDGLAIDPDKIGTAKLRLFGKRVHSGAVARAYYTANGFDETTITWNNQPPTSIVDGRTLMGETSEIPDSEGWYEVPIDPFFVRHRWGRNFWVILKGTEAPESYAWAYDKEAVRGAYPPTLYLSEEAAAYALTIGVTPGAGKVGDVFDFRGTLTLSGSAVPNQWIDLVLEGVGTVGNALTDSGGSYSIPWVADREGALRFHAEAPMLAMSDTVALFIPSAPDWLVPAIIGSIPVVFTAAVVVAQEVEKRG